MSAELISVVAVLSLIAGVCYAVWRSPLSWSVAVAVATLPFLQVPALKVLARWRLTDVLLAAIALRLVLIDRDLVRERLRQQPVTSRIALASVAFYAVYTGGVGIMRALTSPELAQTKLVAIYFVHPLLRVALETARMVAVVALIVAVVVVVVDEELLKRVLTFSLIGGIVVLVYAAYQTVAFFYIDLPLFPGTFQLSNGRVGATFFEPTGFGSFAAVVAFLGLARWQFDDRQKMLSLAAVMGGAFAAQFVISRAAAIAMIGGLILIVIAPRLTFRRKIFLVTPVIVFSVAGLFAAIALIGPGDVKAVYTTFRLGNDLRERVADLRAQPGEPVPIGGQLPSETPLGAELRRDLLEYVDLPLRVIGVGQGVALISSGRGSYGIARLVQEGGVPGVVALGFFHICVLASAVLIWRRRTGAVQGALPPLVAAYGASSVITLNYANVTDAWLWFAAALLLAAAGQNPEGAARGPAGDDAARTMSMSQAP